MKFILLSLIAVIAISLSEVQADTCSVSLDFGSAAYVIQYSVNSKGGNPGPTPPQGEGVSSFTYDDSLSSTPLTFSNTDGTGFDDLVFTITDANGNVIESNISCTVPTDTCTGGAAVGTQTGSTKGETVGTKGDSGIVKGETVGQTKGDSRSGTLAPAPAAAAESIGKSSSSKGKKALACTISSSTCSNLVYQLDFVCPALVGAGGDPHIFAPSLPHAFELASFIKDNTDSFQKKERSITSSPQTQASAVLVDSESLTIVGLIAENQFSNKGRTYFTTMQITSNDKFFSFEPNNTNRDDNIQVVGDIGTLKCIYGQEEEYSITMNSEYYLTLRCNDVIDQAKRNDLIANEFLWHAKYSVASMTIHRTLDDSKAIEMFYVQEERLPQTGTWEAQPFGYIDISIFGFSDSIEGILGKSKQNNFARAVSENEILDFVSQYVVVY